MKHTVKPVKKGKALAAKKLEKKTPLTSQRPLIRL